MTRREPSGSRRVTENCVVNCDERDPIGPLTAAILIAADQPATVSPQDMCLYGDQLRHAQLRATVVLLMMSRWRLSVN